MSWWNHAITHGDVILVLSFWFAWWAVREIRAGYRDGQRKRGAKPFRQEVRERAEQKRKERASREA